MKTYIITEELRDEAASELESEIRARYEYEGEDCHPSQRHKFECDMETVHKLRALPEAPDVETINRLTGDMDEEIKQLNAACDSIRSQLTEKQGALQEALDDAHEQRERCVELTRRLAENDQKITSLMTRLADATNDCQSAIYERDEARNKLAENEKECAGLREAVLGAEWAGVSDWGMQEPGCPFCGENQIEWTGEPGAHADDCIVTYIRNAALTTEGEKGDDDHICDTCRFVNEDFHDMCVYCHGNDKWQQGDSTTKPEGE